MKIQHYKQLLAWKADQLLFWSKVLVEVKENDYDITLECDDDADIAIVYRQSLFLRLNKTIPTIPLT